MKAQTASEIWAYLNASRTEVLTRAEEHAQYTLPYLFTPEGANADEDGASSKWQSFGAQVVNHLVTKLVLALFAPSRPFLRLDASPEAIQEALAAGISKEDLDAALAEAERSAVKLLDQLALRPKIFELLKHLVVTGNALQILDDKERTMRVLSLKHYVVKRDISGGLHTCVIRENVALDELDPKVLELPAIRVRYPNDSDEKVEFFILIKRVGSKYEVTQWVGDIKLPDDQYTKTFTPEKLPYRVQTWNLPDEADYGIGMVGECEGDFAAISTLSQAMIEGAVLASEYRWLLSPGSQMKPEDFAESPNGGTIPGQEGDLSLVNAAGAIGQSLQVQQAINADYVNRIGRTFLLSSAVTRQAERVTAEEIRMVAQELETGLGGGYSRLAVDLQLPLGMWLLRLLDLKVGPKAFVPLVVTGLDALSRNGDLENLTLFLKDLVSLGTAPPEVLEWIVMDVTLTDLATMRGVSTKYIRKEAQVQQNRMQRQAAQVGADVATAAGQAAADQAAQGEQPQ